MTRIVVAGAGSVGCWIGGCLALAGRDVGLLARPRIGGELAEHGLRLTDYRGLDERLAPGRLDVSTDPAILAGADVVLVTVKSRDTREMAGVIAEHAPAGCVVASLQNGVGNRRILSERLPEARVLSVMVPFNVLHRGEGAFHRGTEGDLEVQIGVHDDLIDLLDVRGVGAHGRRDIDAVLWSKLLLNLNNALNALSDLPLKAELRDRAWRRVLADMIDEALASMRAAGIRPKPIGKVLPSLVPRILRLPTPVFERVAASMLAIDPEARSSMWEDLRRGRRTEVGFLQGEIVRLGEAHAVPTPMNRAVRDAIEAREGICRDNSRPDESPHARD